MTLRPSPACFRLILFIISLMAAFWPAWLHAQDGASVPDADAFDIGIIIDNRPLPRSDAARADVDALFTLLDRQMFIEHIMVFERPTISVICDLFGCPEAIEPVSPHAPLIWQITRADQARLFVYYIGDGRIEGVTRQLLFQRRDDSSDEDVVGFPVGWLHEELERVAPQSAMVMLDTSFSPTRLPCTSGDPRLADDALMSIRRNYQQIARDHWGLTETIELSATTPVQVAHCDRLDHMLEGAKTPLFTKFLLKGIVGAEADQDKDKLIDLGELSDYLDDRIGRTVRFQWGRRQNVRVIGARSQAVASVDQRELSAENAKVLARRSQPLLVSDEEEKQDVPSQDQGQLDDRPADIGTNVQKNRCQDDSEAEDCHPCVQEPDGKACADLCRENASSDLCARNLTSGPEVDPDETVPASDRIDVIAVPIDEGGQEADPSEERSAACQFVADHIAPFASVLVQRIEGDTEPACTWAKDRSTVERGPIGQIFTPVVWRLGRGKFQDAASCLLDCDQMAEAIDISASSQSEPAEQPEDVAPALVDPRALGPFNREICDRMHEPLPAYIGLPRWMPGTLILSEALRVGYGCPPRVPEPALPKPVVVALETPATRLQSEPQKIDPSPKVNDADDRLANWPPHAVDIDVPPGDGETQPGETEGDPEIADATPPDGNGRQGEQQDEQQGPVEETFVETVNKVRWLQSALTLGNHHPGPIDGALGRKTMDAVRSWRRDNDREGRTGELTEVEFQKIIRAFAERFGQLHERIGSF